MTHHAAHAVALRVSDFHRQAMVDHRETYGRTQHHFDLPAIAWRQILDEMKRVCFTPGGGRSREVPSSAFTAIQRIAQAVMEIESHPALRGARVEGWSGMVIPAWVTSTYPMDATPYPPAPEIAGMFRLLVPQHETLHGLKVTRWDPVVRMEPASSWTFSPDTHWQFVGQPVSADSELLTDQFELETFVVGQPFLRAERRDVEDLGGS